MIATKCFLTLFCSRSFYSPSPPEQSSQLLVKDQLHLPKASYKHSTNLSIAGTATPQFCWKSHQAFCQISSIHMAIEETWFIRSFLILVQINLKDLPAASSHAENASGFPLFPPSLNIYLLIAYFYYNRSS